MSDFFAGRVRSGVPAGGEFAPRSLPDSEATLTVSGPAREENFQVAQAEFEQARERLLVTAVDLIKERALAALPDAGSIQGHLFHGRLLLASISGADGSELDQGDAEVDGLVSLFGRKDCVQHGWAYSTRHDCYELELN